MQEGPSARPPATGCVQRRGKPPEDTMRLPTLPLLTAAVLLAAVPIPPALAQEPAPEAEPAPRRVVALADITGIYAHPLGEFADQIERGFGLGLGLSVPVRRGSPLHLRLEGNFINYGRETREVCLSPTIGCRVQVRLTTTNDILSFGVGPELAPGAGAVRPFLHGFGGLTAFATSSSLRGRNHEHSFANTVNHDHLGLAWGGGGGVRVELPVTATPVFLHLAGRYQNNGRVEYLREGDITDRPDGSIVLHPQRSRADLVTVQLGVSAGIQPRSRGRGRFRH
jgi:hypothetical protein